MHFGNWCNKFHLQEFGSTPAVNILTVVSGQVNNAYSNELWCTCNLGKFIFIWSTSVYSSWRASWDNFLSFTQHQRTSLVRKFAQFYRLNYTCMFETTKEGQFVEPCFENFNLIIPFFKFWTNYRNTIFTTRQQSFWKVMFSVVSICSQGGIPCDHCRPVQTCSLRETPRAVGLPLKGHLVLNNDYLQ